MRSALMVAAGVALATALWAPSAASAAIVPPGQDPFYTYSGNLHAAAPGAVLKQRSVEIVLAGGTQTPIAGEQLLFRTTNELGAPALGVTTVISPATGGALLKIVSWQPFYDSLGPDCDPSYALRGGGNPTGCSDDAQLEESAASTFLAQGDTVVMTDYEETNEAYGAGRLEGYATLDGIRATETYLHDTPASTPVAMVGYSGGAIASQWAAELAPAYAQHVDLVGTAAGGVFVDPFHSLSFINGNATGWSDVIPVYLILLQRAFGVPVAPYLSTLGAKVYKQDENTSISDFTTTGFTTFQELVKPQYGDVSKVRPFVQALDQLIMGSDGTPKSPMFLGNGEGTKNNGWDGDGIMITDDVEALAHEYCSRGVPVEFQVYSGLPHVEAFAPFISYAIPYLTDRLNGLPAPSNCSSVGTGNSLAPEPIPAAASHARHHKHSKKPRHHKHSKPRRRRTS
jgi:pimeloyl-ACP methyl ester carboxylesterase